LDKTLYGLLVRNIYELDGQVITLGYSYSAMEKAKKADFKKSKSKDDNKDTKDDEDDDDDESEPDEDEMNEDDCMREIFPLHGCSEPVGTEIVMVFAMWPQEGEPDRLLEWKVASSFKDDLEIEKFREVCGHGGVVTNSLGTTQRVCQQTHQGRL
jgi:hypothetical protein